MTLPANAMTLIAQAIADTGFAMHTDISERWLIRMTEQIEMELEAGGYVILTLDELRGMLCDEYEEEP